MNFVYAVTICLLIFVKAISSETIFEWGEITEKVGDEVINFRAISFEYVDQKFYLALVDKNKKTPGIGYIAWFSPSGDPTPKLNVHGYRENYKIFHENGHIMAPMLIRADPCGDIWVMDANMYNLTGARMKLKPMFHILGNPKNNVSLQWFRNEEWDDDYVFMNVAFEVSKRGKDSGQCAPIDAYLANAVDFTILLHRYPEDASGKHPYQVRYQKIPEIHHHLFREGKFGGIEGMVLAKNDRIGSVLVFHLGEGTSEYIIPLENVKNQTSLHQDDVKVVVQKGSLSEAGRSAYDSVTDTVFFAEYKTRKIGVMNVSAALNDSKMQPYERYDIGITEGVITDIKVIGPALWVLISSGTKTTLKKTIISDIIVKHKMKITLSPPDILCELLECNDKNRSDNSSCDIHINLLLLICIIFLIKLQI